MAEVTPLWFACSNPECNYIPIKTKKEKIKRYWKHGLSVQQSARARLFMRYVQGHYERADNGNILYFNCKYGRICMYDHYDKQEVNSFLNPVVGQEMCGVCITKIDNQRRLLS